MQFRSRLFTFLSAIVVLIVLGVTAGVSKGDEAAPSLVMESLIQDSADQSFMPAQDSADQCFAPDQAEEAADDSALYECRYGAPYCQRASQCATYCGSLDFAVCFQGCCTCSG